MEDITVLMTTYNESKEIFLKAIQSILNQTYKNIKLLVVVDNKNNKEIIKLLDEYKEKDRRVSYIVNFQNIGLAKSLNKAIDLVQTKYIARMDADDISVSDRIEKQYEFAKKNEEIVLFGSNIYYIDFSGNVLYKRKEHSNVYNDIKETMKYINIFHHPTFFGRTEIFKKYKYRNLQYSQDYDLICRLLEDNYKIGNMNEYLLYYRIPKNVRDDKMYKQKITYYCIQEEYKKGSLNETNIEKKVEDELKNKNKKCIIRGFKYYDKALELFKQKSYVLVLIYIMRSFSLSKYQRTQIKNLIKYYIKRGA